MSDGFALAYGVELLCTEAPVISKARLLASLEARCPGVAPLDGKTDSELLSFVHPAHMVKFADGELPAQTLVAVSEEPPNPERLKPALQQTYAFDSAQAAIDNSAATVVVTDMMCLGMLYEERLDLFQHALMAVLDLVDCNAIHWRPTQQIVDPFAYRMAYATGERAQRFFAGSINVRSFNIENDEDVMVMDTLGLSAVGAFDLQCHFRDLEPQDVARLLFNLAWYMFVKGSIIADGHTVDGIDPGSMWLCHYEDALMAPERTVLDIDPGPSYRARKREP